MVRRTGRGGDDRRRSRLSGVQIVCTQARHGLHSLVILGMIQTQTETLTDLLSNVRERIRTHVSRKTATPSGAFETLSREELSYLLEPGALSVFIPGEYGGRGGHISEGLSMLETASYESLPVSLILGINGALFLQPLSRYGNPDVCERVYGRFIKEQAVGGLMITEPDYGSEALGMQTSFEPTGNGYRIRGTKHWGGLTGMADYWMLTARPKNSRGELGRGVSMFVWEQSQGGIHVPERYQTLGLSMIPYGRNEIDTVVPEANQLKPEATGLRMFLDTLHRSRLQFPGMAIGYLRRLSDDALAHVRTRIVGGHPLLSYDQVRSRLAALQARVTTCAAMCVYSVAEARTDHDTSPLALAANSIKSVATDYMQSAAQSVMQLFGGNGYRREHIAARSLADSRPFQIFEGSNDILYEQITEMITKGMKRAKETNLFQYLRTFDATSRAAESLRHALDIDLKESLPQRKIVQLGRALGRVVSLQMLYELADRGYPSEHIANADAFLREQISALLHTFSLNESGAPLEDNGLSGDWLSYTD